MRFIIAGFAGAFATLIAGTLIAISMQPVVAPHFGSLIRTEAEGLLFTSLIAGYLVIGFCLAYLAKLINPNRMTILNILTVGFIIGLAIFFGDHLITAGWSHLHPVAMAISGFVDSLAVIAGFYVVCLVYRYKAHD